MIILLDLLCIQHNWQYAQWKYFVVGEREFKSESDDESGHDDVCYHRLNECRLRPRGELCLEMPPAFAKI